jgi:hypothetical protein
VTNVTVFDAPYWNRREPARFYRYVKRGPVQNTSNARDRVLLTHQSKWLPDKKASMPGPECIALKKTYALRSQAASLYDWLALTGLIAATNVAGSTRV